MAMQAASLEVLEKANVPAPQARAIVQAIGFELLAARDTLATKHDILLLRQDVREQVAEVRREISEVRAEVRQEISEARAEVRQEMAEGRVRLESVKAELVRWVFLAVVGLIPIQAAMMYFLLKAER